MLPPEGPSREHKRQRRLRLLVLAFFAGLIGLITITLNLLIDELLLLVREALAFKGQDHN
jgi:hypothetical protein